MRPDCNVFLLREDLESKHKKLLYQIEKFGDLYNAVIDKIPDGALVQVEVQSTCVMLTVSGNREVLYFAFKALRAQGFEPVSRPKAGETSYGSYFSHAGGAKIWFYFSSTECRRVKVGVQLVEQDVFETVCGEQVNPTDPAQIERERELLGEVV